MNLDRIVSIISLLIGFSGVGLSIYLANPSSNANVVSLSGWLASAIITVILSVSAFKAIQVLQNQSSSAIEALQNEIVRAKDDSIKHQNDFISQQNDLVSYRNISAALSSMINPEPIKDTIRNKLASYMDNAKEQKDE